MNKPVALNLNLIITIVDGSNGPDVIDFAKDAGASGGTILHGRGAGVHDAGKFLGLDIEPEKDIVLVLVPARMANQVLDSIYQGMELAKPGNGVVFAVDVSKVMGITKIHEYCEVVDLEDLLTED